MMGALATKQRSLAAPRPNTKNTDDFAAYSIDGEVVVVDKSDYKLDGSALAVVFRWDGSVGLEYPKTADGRFWAGERSGFYGEAGTKMIRTVGCVIVGRVIQGG